MAKLILSGYLILSITLFLYNTSLTAEANGRITNYQIQNTDLYTIKLGTVPPSPQIGKTHFSIKIIDIVTDKPVTGNDIYLSLKHSESNDWLSPQKTYTSPFDPSAFEFNYEFDIPGTWQVKVMVNTLNSTEHAVFEIFVNTFSALPGILTLIFLIVLVSTFAYIIRIIISQKRRNQES